MDGQKVYWKIELFFPTSTAVQIDKIGRIPLYAEILAKNREKGEKNNLAQNQRGKEADRG